MDISKSPGGGNCVYDSLVFTHGNFEGTALSLDMLDGNPPQALISHMEGGIESIKPVMQLPKNQQAFPNMPDRNCTSIHVTSTTSMERPIQCFV